MSNRLERITIANKLRLPQLKITRIWLISYVRRLLVQKDSSKRKTIVQSGLRVVVIHHNVSKRQWNRYEELSHCTMPNINLSEITVGCCKIERFDFFSEMSIEKLYFIWFFYAFRIGIRCSCHEQWMYKIMHYNIRVCILYGHEIGILYFFVFNMSIFWNILAKNLTVQTMNNKLTKFIIIH